MPSNVYPRVLFKTISLAHDENGEPVIKIKFPFSQTDLDNVRTIPGRKFHKSNDCWSCPLSVWNVQILSGFGFSIKDPLKEWLEKEKTKQPALHIPGLKGTLKPYQEDFVRFAEPHDGCVLCADDMGLGKTVEAIAWLQLRQDIRPVLLVCPASLKINWEREILKWMTGVKPVILQGQKPYKFTGDIAIINYDIVHFWEKALIKKGFQILICDEAHALKNNSTRRTKAIKKLRKEIPRAMSLTGTPIENAPVEIFNAVSLVNKTIFPDYWKFLWKFCDPKNDGFGWKFNGSKNTEELHQILKSTVMIRRLKSEVLSELPPKIRTFIPIELTNRDEYNKAERDFIGWVREHKGHEAALRAKNAEALSKIEGLKQVAVKGKMKGVIQWVQDFLETENKLVVVCTHNLTISSLVEAFPTALVIDGKTTGANRQKAVDSFQEDPAKNLIILNLIAGGVGLTLTAAASELIVELGMNPKKMDQVEDRIHRVTQTRGVNIYYGLAINTIEEKLAKLLDKKRKVIDAVIDGIDTDSSSLLYELMQSYS